MRILIVEDEPDLLRSLTQALQEEGYAVDTAADGQTGLYNAQNYDYDAVVLDVMLPKLDGWEILRRLRLTKKTPVLMLTARDQSKDRVRGLDTGADDYVVKPFDLPELFARLRALIRRHAGQAGNVLTLGDIVIDTGARQITQAGRPVALTAREYALVEFLALHMGQVVTIPAHNVVQHITVLIHSNVSWSDFAYLVLWAVVVLAIGLRVFRKYEARLPEEL